MFTELLPLLKERTLTMTVSLLKGSEKDLRVCIVPKQFEYTKLDIGYDKDAEALSKKIETASSALNTPLSITGTAEEIDATLPKALADYAPEMQSLHCDIDQVRKDLEAAKAALDEAKKAKGKTHVAKPATDAKNAETKKAEIAAKSDDAPTLGLFDSVPTEESTAAPETATSAPAPAETAAPEPLLFAAVSSDDNTTADLELVFENAAKEVA